MTVSRTWGTTPEERRLVFPCDRSVERPKAAVYRGVTVRARPEAVFRWLCQLRVAPYSYDWIDNLGRRSPRSLTPGLDRLAVGQRVMTIFELVDFEPNRHLTIRLIPGSRATRLYGDITASYLIMPQGPGRCRLLAKLSIAYPRGWIGRLGRALLPWGDLIMMRRQLLNLKALAERMPSGDQGPREDSVLSSGIGGRSMGASGAAAHRRSSAGR